MKRRGCLLGRTPGGDEKCPPGACRRCGWEAANAERRRARAMLKRFGEEAGI